MAGRAFTTSHLDELRRESGFAPIRKELDVRSFGVNAWTAAEAGAPVIREHDEQASGHEELYLVAAGSATFTVGGEDVDAPSGTLVLVRDPGTARGAVAREPGTTVVAMGGTPGEAYRPRAWETNDEVFALFDSGDHAQLKSVLTDALGRYDDRAGILYNLACAETQLGETDEAIEHLHAAISERAAFADDARADEDLAPLRAHPRFAEVVGVS